MTIVKVQRPLASNDPGSMDLCLIYPETNSPMTEQKVSSRVWKLLVDEPKLYFEAGWDHEAKQWVLGERALRQEW